MTGAVRAPGGGARPRLLLVGPLPIEGDVIGGTKVSFAALARDLAAGGRFEVEVRSTARPRAGRSRLGRAAADVASLARVLTRLLRRRADGEVCLWSVSAGGALLAGPLVWLACRLRGRPLALRPFGGDLDDALERAPSLLRRAARRTFLASPLVLLQTRALCERLASVEGARWLPTWRDLDAPPRALSDCRGARRFAFVGQLRPEKGVREALAASDALPAGAELVVHGPRMPGFDPAEIGRHPRARWNGPLRSDEVAGVLAESDVLLLPSYHGGEGIPGIVVEALQCGVPVIASRWRSLPEIVEDGGNGLLVEPRDAEGLARAMRRLHDDEELWRRLAAGARESGERWRGREWSGRLEGWLLELAGRAA